MVAEAQRALAFQNEKDHPEVAPSQFELNYKYCDAVHAAERHYDGPIIGTATEPVITQFTPAMLQAAARLHRERHQWISDQLASHNGVDTATWGVRDALLTFCVESDSPAVKALEL